MINKETAFKKITELVERFQEQFTTYKKTVYNETSTRRDFIDPFFKALGWDMDNEQGYAESYREVIHEDKIKIGRTTKSPDYSFQIGKGNRLFFVEAKKPSVFIKDEIQPAYQVRRYGWSAKLSISILTDFEEFAVYDCNKKPHPTDKASIARIYYITFNNYLKEFDFIWNTFSKESVLKGSFDKYVTGTANKKGTETVDKEFLKSLDNWRTYLATSISWNNKNLDEDEINFAVQQTIDRIIFLRIAEDRGVEFNENLLNAINQGDYYQNLFRIFLYADEKYNSGLFDLKKDKISKNLKIDNKVIKNIITELYYPSPYAFKVIPVEILGTAYEQFLGKVIRITSAHHAKIEEKPEVRKAGGVYYTPQYIVDYIVQNTVGKLIDNKKPSEISKIKIVDPACGSGSFLLGAYQYLLNWHQDYYSKSKSGKGIKNDTLTPDGNLTTKEKKRILLNNIYGVDIDVNAVEVTKLSLLLKCLEGETNASINNQLKLFNERVLPTLEDNIKCGNSLIDTDFYDYQLNLGEEKKIKPFNWQKAFPEVFKTVTETKAHIIKPDLGINDEQIISRKVEEPMIIYSTKQGGGFDIVIGNPPYVQPNILDKESQKYLLTYFKSNTDLYSIFIEKCLKLLKDNSTLGFIIPSLFLKGVRYEKLRTEINCNCSKIEVKEYGDGVFGKVQMPTCIIILTKGSPKKQQNFFENKNQKLFHKINTVKLEEISVTHRGLEIGRNKLLESGSLLCITGSNINRYTITSTKYINKDIIKSYSKNSEIFSAPKIMIRETGDRFFASIDYSDTLTTRSIYNTRIINKNYSTELILGIINSKLFQFYFQQFIVPETNIFPKIRIAQLKEVPIPSFEKKDKKQKQKNDEIIKLVEQLLQLNKEKSETKLQTRIDQLKIKIDYCEEKINKIVYELYGLEKPEIEIIEKQLTK